MRILNLYAGIGGNRRLWGDEHEVTAVEYDPAIAKVYQDLYPNDNVIVGDAHQFLLDHYDEFDFIWSSPPCQSHSRFRFHIGTRFRGSKKVYPDMSLYEEILFLQYNFKGIYVVENVIPYYKPFLEPQQINRHLYWANFEIGALPRVVENLRDAQIPQLQILHGVDLSGYKLKNKRQVLRNCVHSETGKAILDAAIKGENK
jgi:DNA (cytosine-5)-methyltransferase 1